MCSQLYNDYIECLYADEGNPLEKETLMVRVRSVEIMSLNKEEGMRFSVQMEELSLSRSTYNLSILK